MCLQEEGPIEVAPEIIERLVRRPEDLPSHVQENVVQYKSNVLRILEDYMADHDQQYLIELDGNKHVNILFKVSIHIPGTFFFQKQGFCFLFIVTSQTTNLMLCFT